MQDPDDHLITSPLVVRISSHSDQRRSARLKLGPADWTIGERKKKNGGGIEKQKKQKKNRIDEPRPSTVSAKWITRSDPIADIMRLHESLSLLPLWGERREKYPVDGKAESGN